MLVHVYCACTSTCILCMFTIFATGFFFDLLLTIENGGNWSNNRYNDSNTHCQAPASWFTSI